MFEMVSADELARMEALARRVRNELAAAGLPVLAPGLHPVLAGGAEVMVDGGADPAGGVFAGWSASPRLQECTNRALRLRVHTLRHTTASLLKDLKVPPRDAQVILGHAHVSTTQQIYTHVDEAARRDALTRLNKLLGGE